MSTERGPLPHNLEAERTVLGAVLVDNGAFGALNGGLSAHDFYRVGHRHIFEAMAALAERSQPIDLVTLKEELARCEALEAVGGAVYIAGLVDGVPRISNADQWARIIREKALLRNLVNAGDRITQLALQGEASVPELVTRARDLVGAVADAAATGHDGAGLTAEGLTDATLVAAQGREIAETGVPFVVDGMIPAYGMLGMLVAFAKVGKTTLGQALGAAVANGAPFIGRRTEKRRVLYIAAEDPPEYTAWVARHLVTEPGAMTFYRRPVILNDAGLAHIAATAKAGGYGFVLIASWQAVVRGLVRDENDNAGAVVVIERVKTTTRETAIPWLIDAHSGKGEDQEDEADPSRAMRGASAAAGAADYTLSLRYADGAFGNQRRLSGKGRFIMFAPQTLSYDPETGAYESLGSTKDAARETTWRLIEETGALSGVPQTAAVIAKTSGISPAEGKVSGSALRRVHEALRDRDGVVKVSTKVGGKTVTHYSTPSMEGGAE